MRTKAEANKKLNEQTSTKMKHQVVDIPNINLIQFQSGFRRQIPPFDANKE